MQSMSYLKQIQQLCALEEKEPIVTAKLIERVTVISGSLATLALAHQNEDDDEDEDEV